MLFGQIIGLITSSLGFYQGFQPQESKHNKTIANITVWAVIVFGIHAISTFPSLSSIFPQQFFENERVRNLCLEADLLLADNIELAGGPFIVVVVGI
jgi:hypothetical protein